MNKNLIIITSVINVSSNKLSYTNTRSIYSSEERLNQTLESINSIKKYIENYYIVLVEGSELSIEYENILKSNVDYYYNISNSNYKQYIDGISKGLGETSILLAYLLSNHFIENKCNFNYIAKLSGRYYITSKFITSENFNSNKITVKYYHENKQICTIWYTIPINEINDFINVLNNSYNDIKFIEGCYSIENYLYDKWLKDKLLISKQINNIGVNGNIAVDGSIIEI